MDTFNEVPATEIPSQKIYKETPIRIATFLGGPLVAGYLIAQNYKAFNDPDKAKRTWLFTVIGTVVIFAAAFLLPIPPNGSRIIIPLIYSYITFFLVKQYQGNDIATHINGGGEVYSWWRALGISLIGLVITFVILFVIILVADPASLT